MGGDRLVTINREKAFFLWYKGFYQKLKLLLESSLPAKKLLCFIYIIFFFFLGGGRGAKRDFAHTIEKSW